MLHFEDFAVHRVLDLLEHEIFGQFPSGRRGDLVEHLLADGLPLVVLSLPLQSLLDFDAQLIECFDADALEQRTVQFRQFHPLNFFDLEGGLNLLATHGDVLGFFRDGDGRFACVTGFRARQQLVEVGDLAVFESQCRADTGREVSVVLQRASLIVERGTNFDAVTRLNRAVRGDELGVLFEEALLSLVDVGVAGLSNGSLDRDLVVGGKVERGTHLDLEFVFEVSGIGNRQVFDVEVRLVDRLDVRVLRELLEATDEHLLLDFVVEFAGEPLGDDVLGRLARTEARHGGLGLHLVEHKVADVRDVGLRHLHFDVLLAGADVFDIDAQGHAPARCGFKLRFGGRDIGGGRFLFGNGTHG